MKTFLICISITLIFSGCSTNNEEQSFADPVFKEVMSMASSNMAVPVDAAILIGEQITSINFSGMTEPLDAARLINAMVNLYCEEYEKWPVSGEELRSFSNSESINCPEEFWERVRILELSKGEQAFFLEYVVHSDVSGDSRPREGNSWELPVRLKGAVRKYEMMTEGPVSLGYNRAIRLKILLPRRIPLEK